MSESPTIAPATEQPKNLAVFLDGTWNAVESNTNVWRIKSLCAPISAAGSQQLVHYDVGVNGFLGGTFGRGLNKNVREAYEWLIEQYSPGDNIFIFGFSRGAYTARSLSGLIAKHGLLKRGAPLGIAQIYKRYQRSEDRTLYKLFELLEEKKLENVTLEESWMMKYSQRAPIKVVGVWDTVGEVGVPALSVEGISRSKFHWMHTGLRLPILNGYHALAIDEHRKNFLPTLWTVRKPKDPNEKVADPRPLASVEQRWFVGAHANIGGGCDSDLLAQLPLRWMMKKASLHGLSFRNDIEIEGDVLGAPVSDSYQEFAYGLYSNVYRRTYRTIGAPPEEKNDGTHSNVNETIDLSVFERCRARPNYRPPNLEEWLRRKKVSFTSLTNSVRADEPSVSAPD